MGISGISLLIFLMLMPVALYLILQNTKNSLYLLVATFPMFNVETFNLGGGFLVLSPNKVFGALVIVLMVVDVLSKGKEFRFISPHMVLSILLLATLLISFMVNGSRSLSWAQRYLSNLAFLLAMVTWIDTRKEADRVWQVFIYSLAFFTILTLLGVTAGDEVAAGGAGERFEATMLNANRAARTYLIGLGLAMGWLMRSAATPGRRWFGFALVGFFAWFILLTGSRAGFIALLITMAGFPFLLWAGTHTRSLVVPLIVVGALFVVFVPDAMVQRAKNIPNVQQGLEEEEARRSRIHQYRLALDLIDAHPLVGIGPHEFHRVYSKRVEGDVVRVLHSWYLKVAVDAGIPALLCFVGLLLLTFFIGLRGALSDPRPDRRGQAWAFTFMVAGLMAFGVVSSVPYSKLMWLVFSISAVELRLQQKEREAEQVDAVQDFNVRADALGVATGTVVIIKKD